MARTKGAGAYLRLAAVTRFHAFRVRFENTNVNAQLQWEKGRKRDQHADVITESATMRV